MLAKWRHGHNNKIARGFTFIAHMYEVMWAFDQFTTFPYYTGDEEYKSFAHALHEIMQLDMPLDEFLGQAHLATLCHDLGKLGCEFQEMLWTMEIDFQNGTKSKRYKQLFRHEFLSAILMLKHEPIRKFITDKVGEKGLYNVIAGSFGHHLKCEKDRAYRIDAKITKPVPVYLSELNRIKLTDKKSAGFSAMSDTEFSIPNVAYLEDAHREIRRLVKPEAETRVTTAIKWLVILSDTFGSVQASRKSLQQGLECLFGPVDIDYPARIKERLGTKQLSQFQKECRVSGNLIGKASTGAGKTVAALNWAHNNRPLIFTLPTTDTSTALLQDYGLDTDGIRHSRAWLDKKEVFDKISTLIVTPESISDEEKEEQDEAWESIDVFKSSYFETIYATPDQVLGCLAYARKSILWLPVILKSQVVFDECHSYDVLMVNYYRKFCEWFPLIRTAHFSATWTQQLQNSVKAITKGDIKEDSDNEYSRLPRYRIHIIDKSDATDRLFKHGSLYVVNRVQECQDLGNVYRDATLYHSRYKLEDRRKIRDALLNSYRQETGDHSLTRILATQVVEMSFDIDMDCLISEMCPPISAIQRMGRVNRKRDTEKIVDVYFYPPDSISPYTNDTVANWKNWLLQFKGKEVSQKDLEETLNSYYKHTGGSNTTPELMMITKRSKLRRADSHCSCLLKEDADKIEKLKGYDRMKAMALSEISYPLGNRKDYTSWEYRYLLSNSDFKYSERKGLEKK